MSKFFSFCAGILSDNGSPSSSRLMTVVLSVGMLVAVLHVVYYTGHLPPSGDIIGAAAFATCPYGVNTMRNILTKPDHSDGGAK